MCYFCYRYYDALAQLLMRPWLLCGAMNNL